MNFSFHEKWKPNFKGMGKSIYQFSQLHNSARESYQSEIGRFTDYALTIKMSWKFNYIGQLFTNNNVVNNSTEIEKLDHVSPQIVTPKKKKTCNN